MSNPLGALLASEPLNNPQAERVRTTARLSTAAGRKKTGSFLVEGPQAVREALAVQQERFDAARSAKGGKGNGNKGKGGQQPGGATPTRLVEDVFITADRAEREPGLVMEGVRTHLVTDEVLAVLADTVHPQGVVARCSQAAVSVPLDKVAREGSGLIAVLARVQDPGNAGTILRAADAAGASGVIALSGTVDVFSPKVVRSTVGSLFHLPVVTGASLEDVSALLKRSGIAALAADGYGETDLDVLQDDAAARRVGSTVKGAAKRFSLTSPTAWFFGNEGQGLSEEELAVCLDRVAIPLYGRAESLNVGTAATLCLYASARAQRGS
ncbi:MAG: TrmH family RNA methyltransferase [Galactobacter sp.]